MSVESTEALERSVLESKDREQLLAIASALGVKAGSRAKKADIIDKILESTGVTTAAPAAAAPETTGRGRNGNGRGAVAQPAAATRPASVEDVPTTEPASARDVASPTAEAASAPS